ncbi:High-affinity zinc uptake system membrane protein znuB [Vibrio nigripulchritudo SFn118]|nr:High-affinity zinc uptake system membrane protein znuB [Vibrio nigripulchritudo SFn118]
MLKLVNILNTVTNMIEFLLPSIIAGIAIALIAGPLGSFVVWRRMAYFGDTLAHASLLGLSLGFLLDINIYLALVVCCVALAMILVTLQKQKVVATDTLLGILAHSSLSLGLVAISFFDNVRVDLMGYLFGDLLAVSPEDLTFIFAGGIFIIAVLVYFWQPLLSSSVNEELANIEGINADFMRLILMLLVGIVIAVGMKFVGALLITSLMIIPAAAARRFSSTPEQMAVLSSVFGVFAVLSGLTFSWNLDTPAGPSVVISAAMIFILSQFKRVTH